MKKSLLSLALLGVISTGAQASVLTFVEPDSDAIEFDGFDFSVSTAIAEQYDAAPFGTLEGNENFVEFGGFSTVSMDLGGTVNGDAGVGVLGGEYEIFIEYTLTGTADVLAAVPLPGSTFISQLITLTGGTATFYIEEGSVDGNFSGPMGAGVTQLMTASLNSEFSSCTLGATFDASTEVVLQSGGCTAHLNIDDVTSGYFFADSTDWADIPAGARQLTASLDVIGFDGLYFSYAAQEAALAAAGEASDGIGVQVFEIEHDASASFVIPEPMSIAMMGLGLIGVAGFSRRRAK